MVDLSLHDPCNMPVPLDRTRPVLLTRANARAVRPPPDDRCLRPDRAAAGQRDRKSESRSRRIGAVAPILRRRAERRIATADCRRAEGCAGADHGGQAEPGRTACKLSPPRRQGFLVGQRTQALEDHALASHCARAGTVSGNQRRPNQNVTLTIKIKTGTSTSGPITAAKATTEARPNAARSQDHRHNQCGGGSKRVCRFLHAA